MVATFSVSVLVRNSTNRRSSTKNIRKGIGTNSSNSSGGSISRTNHSGGFQSLVHC